MIYRQSLKDQIFMKMTYELSQLSTCPRRSVGCIITNERNEIISTGYNGIARNIPHCTTRPCGGELLASGVGLSVCKAIHAETNALIKCSNVQDICTIYVTTAPCIDCAKLISNTSCKRVIYFQDYTIDSIDYLKKCGINCMKI
jgi:dCMP deaminase